MSDRELPEREQAAMPLIVFGILGLAGLFVVGLIASVLFRGEGLPPAPREENLKKFDNLLGAEDTFRVRFETTAGPFVVQVHPEWAPYGATQFRQLVEAGFYDENRFFRVVPNFVAQFGISGEPDENRKWNQPIPDDPVMQSNTKGTLAFAKPDLPNSRTTQLFINLKDNSGVLDEKGFPAFAEVVEGMENVEKINSEYNERPNQGQIEAEGNAYLTKNFPNLDFIQSAKIVE